MDRREYSSFAQGLRQVAIRLNNERSIVQKLTGERYSTIEERWGLMLRRQKDRSPKFYDLADIRQYGGKVEVALAGVDGLAEETIMKFLHRESHKIGFKYEYFEGRFGNLHQSGELPPRETIPKVA